MPIRVKAWREALFAPLPGNGSRLTLRSASVSLNGTPLTCILTSSGANQQIPANGRQWYENEYCIDPATSTLRVSSIAPLEAQINSVTDADPSNLTIYTPTAQMMAHADAPVIEMPERFPQFFAAPAGSVSAIQPVIVHATLNQQGKILEIEALQSLPAGASPHLREAFISVKFRPVQN